LARLSESRRLQALAIALRFSARYSPLNLLTKDFLIFIAKVVAPAQIRRFFYRPDIEVQV
jgi:hypothetical protein